jgi:DNA-binding MarR family transcriptional regulator
MTAPVDVPDADTMAASIRTLLRTFTIDERRFPPAKGQLPYNGADFQTLHFVGTYPGCKSAELAAFLGVAPTTAQSVIDRLIKRGLISRSQHAKSKRAVALTLTAQGATVRDAINAQDRANCQAMLAALPAKVHASFVAQLSQISHAFDQIERD